VQANGSSRSRASTLTTQSATCIPTNYYLFRKIEFYLTPNWFESIRYTTGPQHVKCKRYSQQNAEFRSSVTCSVKMDDSNSTKSPKAKESSQLEEGLSPIMSSDERIRRPSETGHRILFAPDVFERRRQRSDEFPATLTLTRTLSRQSRFSSYSAASDEETARVKRVTSRRAVEPHTRLPTCSSSFNRPH